MQHLGDMFAFLSACAGMLLAGQAWGCTVLFRLVQQKLRWRSASAMAKKDQPLGLSHQRPQSSRPNRGSTADACVAFSLRSGATTAYTCDLQ